MKKFMVLILSSVLLSVSGCKEKEAGKVLYIYNWENYIPKEVYEEFSKETGIKIIEEEYSSNEEMYNKLKKNKNKYDLIVPSTGAIKKLKKDKLIQPVDIGKIKTYNNIEGKVIGKLLGIDLKKEDAVPFILGITGIMVNEKYVSNYPKDFSIFEMEEYKGKMSLLNERKDVLGAALLTLELDPNTLDTKYLKAAKELILKWKKNVKFDSKNYIEELNKENYYVSQGYINDFYALLSDESMKNIKFIIPNVGGSGYIDCFVIGKNAKNIEAAYKFIEFIHRPEIFIKIPDAIVGGMVNKEARKLVNSKQLYEVNDLDRLEIFREEGVSQEVQQKYWKEIINE